jgi:hypothetical protein
MTDVAFERRSPMNDRPIGPDVSPSRKFVPDVKPLETRVLLSAAIPRQESIVWQPNPPRTGGVAVQSGSVLNCVVGQPRRNLVQVTDDGRGDVEMSWNFGRPQAFQGIATTVIQAERAGTNQITFSLTGARTSPTAVAVGSIAATNAVAAGGGSHPLRLRVARTGGIAVQTGSLLTVTVNRPKTNIVQINNEGAGAVQVEWNGGPVHSFSGVETIVVDTKNARKDQVTLTDPTS